MIFLWFGGGGVVCLAGEKEWGWLRLSYKRGIVVLTKPLAHQRVDPNRIYWQRNTNVPETTSEGTEEQQEDGDEVNSPSSSSSDGQEGEGSSSSSRPRAAAPRPPSYASEDGVSYVVEAQPRSTIVPLMGPAIVPMSMTMPLPMAAAPNATSPLPVHPSEVGRVGRAPSR